MSETELCENSTTLNLSQFDNNCRNISINFTIVTLDQSGIPSLVRDTYIFIGVFGFSLNLFILLILALYKQSRQSLSNLYIFSQCCVDMSVALLILLTNLLKDPGVEYDQYSIRDNLLCKLWFTQTSMWTMLVSSNYMVVALTVERYIALVHPIFHRAKFSKKTRYSIPIIGSSRQCLHLNAYKF